MNLFWLLILAHVIADFPLQSDTIFALKSKYRWGLVPHIIISFITNLVVAFPYSGFTTFWLAILFLASTHFVLDWLKIILTRRLLSDSLFTFLMDQVLHLFFIWLTCFQLFDIPDPEIYNKFLAAIYLNHKFALALSGIIFSIFGGGVVIHYIRKIIYHLNINMKGPREAVHFPNVNKRRIGYFERLFSTLGTILGGWFLIVIPLAFLPRLIFRGKVDNREFLLVNLISGLFISVGIGLFVHLMW